MVERSGGPDIRGGFEISAARDRIPRMPDSDWFEKNVDDLPMLSEVDWDLALRLEELLQPYALTSAPLRCEAKDGSGTYERASVKDLHEASSERDAPPHTIRLFVNGPEGDGQTPRFLNIQQSCNPNFLSNARFIAGDRATVAVLAERTPTLFAASPKIVSKHAEQTTRGWTSAPTSRGEMRRWWRPDPHDVVNRVVGGVVLAVVLGVFGLLWHSGAFRSGDSNDKKPARTRTVVAPGAADPLIDGYTPANRRYFVCETPQTCPAIGYVTFNSFLNSPYGDERGFFDARQSNAPIPLVFRDHLRVEDGDQVVIRIYVHNDASDAAGGVAASARDVHVLVELPTSRRRRNSLSAQIAASNASPRIVGDTVQLYSGKPFSVSFNRGSPVLITYRPSGKGSFVTRPVPGATFTNDQTMRADFPRFGPGLENAAYVTAVVAVSSL